MDYDIFDVLLVEDNPTDAELIIRALKGSKVLQEIYVAEDGAEALDFIFCTGKYASRNILKPLKAIFLDLKLPKVDGIEVLQHIKSNPITITIPVIMVTSSKDANDIKRAYEAGANSFLVKPVDFKEFTQTLQNAGLYWLSLNNTAG